MNSKRLAVFCATLALTPIAVVSAGELKVLCTTFPIYQITRNVVRERKEADVQLLLPAALGCPHDYALTPQDMQKLVGAKVLVVNGLGMEEFLGAPVKRVNTDLLVVDSSCGITTPLRYQDDRHDHDARTKHTEINPHLFASPRRVAALATTIASGLAKADPAGAVLYKQNSETYAARMNRLADEFVALGKTLKNNRIVTQHGVFDYLARDMGLEVVAVVQAHAGQEPSAADMLKIVKDVREKKAGAIFTEPQYPGKVGQTLAWETGIPAAILDPVATGPEAAPLDYYETVMRKNMETLRATLGINQ